MKQIHTNLDAWVIPEEMQKQFTLMHYHHKAGIALYTDAEGRKVIPKVAVNPKEWADYCLHHGTHKECNLIEELEKLEVVKYSYLEEELI